MRTWTLILVLCLFQGQSFAGSYHFDATSQLAYQHILSLRFDEGKHLLDKAAKENPNNLIPVYLNNYIDFLTVFIGEEQSYFEQIEPRKEVRLEKLEKGDEGSPFHLFVQAEVHLQWAFARIKFGEYITAGLEIRKAFKMLEKNQQKFPKFQPTKKSLGLLHALIGTIPTNYKWVVQLAGLDGTVKQGLEELGSITEGPGASQFIFRNEALIYATFLNLYFLKDEEGAWELIGQGTLNTKDNLLNHFVAANVAMYTGHNDHAIELLSHRPNDIRFHPFPYLEYLLGLAKLRRMDADASAHFSAFLKSFKGKNYIKDALQKLAWSALLNSPESATHYNDYMHMIPDSGYAIVDADKQALKEAIDGITPNRSLLGVRLLFDGGYLVKAKQELNLLELSDLDSKADSMEYSYRYARIEDKLGNHKDAIKLYQATIQLGQESKLYFPARSALQLGEIFEEQGDQDQARFYFNKVLSLKGHAYKNSLDQKAKAGLERIGG
jgi:hypothetical protein